MQGNWENEMQRCRWWGSSERVIVLSSAEKSFSAVSEQNEDTDTSQSTALNSVVQFELKQREAD